MRYDDKMIQHGQPITFITGNSGKAKEYARLLGFEILHQKIDVPEIQALDVRDVSLAKAVAAYELLKRPVFVDDSGLIIDAWNGLPGALIKWFSDCIGNEGFIRMLANEKNRRARVVTSIGYKDADHEFVVTGEVVGAIASKPRGKGGFGYDAVFIPDGQEKTFAEMSGVEKDSVSMRARAVRVFRHRLEQLS